jgi:hypothetical protein
MISSSKKPFRMIGTKSLRTNSGDASIGSFGNGRTSRRWVTYFCSWTDEHKAVDPVGWLGLLACVTGSVNHELLSLPLSHSAWETNPGKPESLLEQNGTNLGLMVAVSY